MGPSWEQIPVSPSYLLFVPKFFFFFNWSVVAESVIYIYIDIDIYLPSFLDFLPIQVTTEH